MIAATADTPVRPRAGSSAGVVADTAADAVEVHTAPGGTPLWVSWAGRAWRTVGDPIWWVERNPWWRNPRPGATLVPEIVVWRVDVVLARARRAEPRTLWLHRIGDAWSVARHLP